MEGTKLAVFLLLCFFALSFAANQAIITVVDSGSPTYHTHPPGSNFTLQVTATYTASGTDKIYYRWQDADKNDLTSNVALTSGTQVNIQSPDTQIGYYALLFSTTGSSIQLPRRNVGETLSYGFAIQNQRGFSVQQGTYFGSVHTDVNDPYMPTWVKTIWWPGATASDWSSTITSEQTKGKLELGIVTGQSAQNGVSWDTTPDDSSAISQTQLNQLKSEAQLYFAAYPTSSADQYVELGLEENLGSNWGQAYFLSNLALKAQYMRQGATAAGATNLKFIYQVVADSFNGAANDDIYNFINSAAFDQFDVLSIHIYPWTTFPYPDTFLAYVVNQAKNWMAQIGKSKPIWFTEAGIPINDPPVSPYEDGGAVTGSTTTRAAIYMARLHALAISLGVQKVFWYHYQDWSFDRNQAEENFGMIIYDGYLQPTYAVMINQQNKLDGTVFVSSATLSSGSISSYRYQQSSANKDLFILWNPTSTSATSVALSSIKSGLSSANAQVYDKVGHPVTITSNSISVADSPIYVVTTISSSTTTTGGSTTGGSTTGGTTTGTVSPSCTIVTTAYAVITTTGGNTWFFNSDQQIEVNNVTDGSTSSVIELAYVNGVLYQLNSWGNWYWKSYPSDAWGGPSTTDPTTVCTTSAPTSPPTSPPTSAPPSYTVFDDSASSGWTIYAQAGTYSWTTSAPYSGSEALVLSVATGSWGLVEFDSGTSLSTSGKTHLVIAVKTSGTAMIQAWNGQWSSSVPWKAFTSYGPAPVSTKWTVYYIPLSDLGVGSLIQSIAIQDQTGQAQTYYFDKLQITTVYVIYEDATVSGWTRQNARSTVTDVTTSPYSGSKDIKYVGGTGTGNTYGNVEFYKNSGSLSLSGYTHFRFAAKTGQSTTNLACQVFAGTWSTSTPTIFVTNYGGQPTSSGWTIYNIPLSAFSTSTVTNIVLSDQSGGNAIVYYYDQVGFVQIS